MTTTREARHAQEMRRRARRRAEERGEAPPEWAAPRDDAEPRGRTSTPGGTREGRDLTAQILRMGVVQRAALALERQAAVAAEAAARLPVIHGAATAVIDDDAEATPGRSKPRRAGGGPEARLRRDSLSRGSEALRAALAVPCSTHHAAPSVACWDINADTGLWRVGLCAARIRAAGFTGPFTRPQQRTPLRSRYS